MEEATRTNARPNRSSAAENGTNGPGGLRSVGRLKRSVLLGLLTIVLVWWAASTFMTNEGEQERDSQRAAVVEPIDAIVLPDGYSRGDTIDLVGAVPKRANNYNPGPGRYGYLISTPDGTNGFDWFRDLDRAIIAGGQYEPLEDNLTRLAPCDAARVRRSYVHVATGNDLALLWSDPVDGGHGLELTGRYYAVDKGVGTFGQVDRKAARPGDPCVYPVTEEDQQRRRGETVATLDEIIIPPGYERGETIDVVAELPDRGNDHTPPPGSYGHILSVPPGTSGQDWFVDLDEAVLATGSYEAVEHGLPVLGACTDRQVRRTYRHIDSGDELTIDWDDPEDGGAGLTIVQHYSIMPGNPGTFALTEGAVPRPGNPCEQGLNE